MNIIKTLAFIFLLCSNLQGQDMTAQLDSIVNASYNDVGPGYAIQIDQNGENLYRKSVGYASLELDVPLRNDHIFRIGSITKQFTAAAIIQLEEVGKLTLDDPIETFIPDYPTLGKTITVEHLLTHTSGIKSYTSMKKFDAEFRKKDMTVLDLIDFFKNEPMDFDPGESFRYNNSGYILLGHIIEVLSGNTYAEYIQKNIFTPLGMKNSSYGDPMKLVKNRASGYRRDNNENIQNAAYMSMTLPYAAGSLLSTTNDLSKWYHAVFSDKVISKANREKAHSTYVLNNGEETGYGYGWTIIDYEGNKVIQHGGGINGFSTSSAYIPSKNTFVTVLANCNCLSPTKLLQKLGATAIGNPPTQTKKIDVPLAQLKQYEGDYKLSPKLTIHISVKDGKLLGVATGQPEVELVPVDKHRFIVEAIDAKIEFNVDNKEVISLTLYQGGPHNAPKVK